MTLLGCWRYCWLHGFLKIHWAWNLFVLFFTLTLQWKVKMLIPGPHSRPTELLLGHYQWESAEASLWESRWTRRSTHFLLQRLSRSTLGRPPAPASPTSPVCSHALLEIKWHKIKRHYGYVQTVALEATERETVLMMCQLIKYS